MTLTVGVLSPFVGGDYYGAIIDGCARAVAEAGGRLIAIQTLDPGSHSADANGVPTLHHPLGWAQITGFVVLPGAAPAEYLQSIQEAGKPVVLISQRLPGLSCPVVLADNRSGVGEAVEHLIGHGHRRIAFVGYLGAGDLRERQQAWAETLSAHDLYDPALLIETDDNHETGGTQGAEALIRAGLPSTASVSGTDLSAIGFSQTLQEAGYALPAEQAVVGFDDITATRYSVPSLSSVRQPLALLGRVAVDLLAARLRGQGAPDEVRQVPTRFVPRESCGCQFTALPAADAAAVTPRPAGAGRLAGDLATVVPPGVTLTPSQSARLRQTAEALTEALQGAARGHPVPPEATLQPMLEDLYRLGPQPQTLGEVAQALRGLADDLTAAPPDHPGDRDGGAQRRVERCIQQVVLQLSHAQARAQFETVSYLQEMLNGQYQLGMELLRSHERDPRQLSWLHGSPLRAGSLALWFSESDPDPDPDLRLVGSFRRDGAVPAGSSTMPVSAFPPADLLAVADSSPDDVTFVVPVRSATRDWGVLAGVGPVQSRTPPGREVMNQSGALLAVALDQDSMLNSLREQEERLRRAALYDQLTGLANRSLFLDRLDQSLRRARHTPDYQFAVLFLDLDGFKSINDSLGHAAGDQVLMEAAERIRHDIRETDTAARFGGDEFLVLLDGFADGQTPERVNARLGASLSRAFHPHGQQVTISASIGMSLSDAATSSEDLLRRADAAMYRTKARRNAERSQQLRRAGSGQ